MKNAFRDVFAAIRTAALHPRIVLFAWLAILVPAAFVVWPVFTAQDAAMAHHADAGFRLDRGLDADYARIASGQTAGSFGAVVFALLAGVFITGGVLSGVGIGVRERVFSSFLADGARLFFRNCRALFVAALVSFCLVQGFDAVAQWWHATDGGAGPHAELVSLLGLSLRRAHVATLGSYAAGFVFLLVVFTTKLAMARLSLLDRRSAVLAFARATVDVGRQPLRVATALALFVVVWLGVNHLIGMVTVRFLEVGQSLWLGLAIGQLGALFTALLVVAAPLVVRRWLNQPSVAGVGNEPIVEIPRGVPRAQPKISRPAAKTSSATTT